MADIGKEIRGLANSLSSFAKSSGGFPGFGRKRFSLSRNFDKRLAEGKKGLSALRTIRDAGISLVIIGETLGAGKFLRRKIRETRETRRIRRARRLVEGTSRISLRGRVSRFKEQRAQRRLDDVARARITLRKAGLLRKPRRRKAVRR